MPLVCYSLYITGKEWERERKIEIFLKCKWAQKSDNYSCTARTRGRDLSQVQTASRERKLFPHLKQVYNSKTRTGYNFTLLPINI